MQKRISLLALLALAVTGSLITAQTDTKKAQEPQRDTKEASAPKSEAAMPLEFGVTGLTKESAAKVEETFAAMETPVFACEACKHEQATAGSCPSCKGDLKAAKKRMFSGAVASLEAGTVRVTPMAARTVRYSDLESALTKSSVKIDEAKFRITDGARLVLRGGTLEDANVIEKALTDAKLFERVKADFDAASKEIHVTVLAKATPPLRSQVVTVLEGLDTDAKLADVIWGPMPTPKPTKA